MLVDLGSHSTCIRDWQQLSAVPATIRRLARTQELEDEDREVDPVSPIVSDYNDDHIISPNIDGGHLLLSPP